jgi:sporulation protein YlmC with PRC-barrel domain
MRSDEDLRGRTVIASDGRAIGALKALRIDETTWRVAAIQIALTKEIADRIGIKRSVFHPGTIDVPIDSVQSVGDAIVLTVAVDALRVTPPPPAVGPQDVPIH